MSINVLAAAQLAAVSVEIGMSIQVGDRKGPELTGENRNSGPDQNTYATRAYLKGRFGLKSRCGRHPVAFNLTSVNGLSLNAASFT